jgi:hypothetical protein
MPIGRYCEAYPRRCATWRRSSHETDVAVTYLPTKIVQIRHLTSEGESDLPPFRRASSLIISLNSARRHPNLSDRNYLGASSTLA